MKQIIFVFSSFLIFINMIFSQEIIKLYPSGHKESNRITTTEQYSNPEFLMNISEPRFLAFHAPKEKANGTAVLICPGGGYVGLSIITEGSEFAKWFNDLGISAFVLYYRMPNGHNTIPLKDAQTALSIIRIHAKEWNIDKKKIGIIGSSAGGHLASTVGTHFKTNMERPAFMILCYPVITMDSTFTHLFTKNNLLGKHPTDELVKYYSNELHVSNKTPPTIIFHATDDKIVPVNNSIQLYKVLKENMIEAELDTFAVGGHGFGMRKRGIPADNWPELLKMWLKKNKLI